MYVVGIIISFPLNIFLIEYFATYSLDIDFKSNETFALLLKFVLTGPGHKTDILTFDLYLLNSSAIDVVSLKTYALVE